MLLGLALLLSSCASSPSSSLQKTAAQPASLKVEDLSCGLPQAGLWRQRGKLADLDGDGWPEILLPPPRKASPEDKRLYLFRWDPASRCWREEKVCVEGEVPLDYGALDAADLDGDGRLDLALAIHQLGLYVLLNRGQQNDCLTFEKIPDFPAPEDFMTRTVLLRDLDQDGRTDVIAAAEAPFGSGSTPKGLLVVRNTSSGWEAQLVKDAEGLFADDLEVADLDGDGYLDLIWAPLTGIEGARRLVFWGPDFKQFLEVSDLWPQEVIYRVAAEPQKYSLWASLGAVSLTQKERFKVSSLKIQGRKGRLLEAQDLPSLVKDLAFCRIGSEQKLLLLQEEGLSLWSKKGPLFLDKKIGSGGYFLETWSAKDGCLMLIGRGKEGVPGGLKFLRIRFR